MLIQKTLIIMAVIFFSALIKLNFDFGKSQLIALYTSLFDTTLESEAQDELSGQTYLYPIANGPRPTVTPVPVAKNTVPILSSRLYIPSLGISAPIVFEPTTLEKRIYSALERGVVHYADTPVPGSTGTSIILGHSSAYSWYKGKYGQIFSQLSKLGPGDIITIEKEPGQQLTYQVTKSLIFSPKDNNDFELRELESTTGSSLVLMTCWPTGTNAKRIAVRADLI